MNTCRDINNSFNALVQVSQEHVVMELGSTSSEDNRKGRIERERDKEGERDRERDRQTESETERKRDRVRERERKKEDTTLKLFLLTSFTTSWVLNLKESVKMTDKSLVQVILIPRATNGHYQLTNT